jgi:hypothetical protein
MIENLYLRCLRVPMLRKPLRQARARLQGIAGYIDPFYELADLRRASGVGLFLDIGCHHGETLRRFIESGINRPVAALDPSGENIEKAGDIRNLLEKNCGLVLKKIYPCLHDKAGRAVQMDALWVRF